MSNETNTIETVYTCECAIPCAVACPDAMERATAAILATRKGDFDHETEIVGTGWIACHDEYATDNVRWNRGNRFDLLTGRIAYDAPRVRSCGLFRSFDGRATHGRDTRRERMILASGSRDDARGAYGESGATLVSDVIATDGASRADAANRLCALLEDVTQGRAKLAEAIETARTLGSLYGTTEYDGAARVRLHRARACVREGIAQLPEGMRAEVSECLSVLGMLKATTRPDARGGNGSGRTLRQGRALLTVSRTSARVAVGAGGK